MKNNYKFLAVDMDGTLLNGKKEITPFTLDCIKKMMGKGNIFCISTGRPYAGIKKYAEIIGGDFPLIMYNGAVVRFSASGKVLLKNGLSVAQSQEVIDIIRKNNGLYIYWANEKLYASEINETIINYSKISGLTPVKIDPDNIPHGDIIKIIWFDSNEKLKEYQQTVLKDVTSVNFFTSQPTFLEFVSKSISKASAMEILANYYGITGDCMIAAGDGCNDIPMLRYAGLGIAMENAEQEVKDNSGEITASNEEDGVGKIIEKYLL